MDHKDMKYYLDKLVQSEGKLQTELARLRPIALLSLLYWRAKKTLDDATRHLNFAKSEQKTNPLVDNTELLRRAQDAWSNAYLEEEEARSQLLGAALVYGHEVDCISSPTAAHVSEPF